MKPIGVSGIITSLFTYTAPTDGVGGSTPKHNEIDIEFEGSDPMRVQLNYFTDDEDPPLQKNEHHHYLGFDASKSFNVYGFRWAPWGIEWQVNGQSVRYVDNSNDNTTPKVTSQNLQKILANAWVVAKDMENNFGGYFDAQSFTEASAEYKWIRYTKLDQYARCSIPSSC
ncbi:unnamed protein product [Agarophyton chilense]|eukprot:gb/GEZJ01004000.1/.p1 GENE.gb/GEZJ01004000.1/~~gb/GEZJ01004000.1/.p1  ORF type:complete len:170 (-),score=17.45 gb/GEZJ01004000.1/:202-711(-)